MLTTTNMVNRVSNRTHFGTTGTDLTIITGELNAAKDWVYNRIFASQNGPDLLMTFDAEITLNSTTRDWDAGANVGSDDIYGVKTIWVKFTSDTIFTPAVPRDAGDDDFIWGDAYTSANPTPATGHPVFVDYANFAKVRFSPPLPSGTIIRLDYWRRPPDLDESTHNTLAYGADVPEPFLEAIMDKATAQCFVNISDDRVAYWERSALEKLVVALQVAQKRRQGPIKTTGFRIKRRRFF